MRSTVCLVAISTLAACQARRAEPGFTGAWILRDQGRNVMVLKLAEEGDQVTGTLTRPEQVQFSSDGLLERISGGPVESTVRDGRVASGRLEFTVARPDGPEPMLMTLDGDGHADVRFADAPDWMAPLKFERATGADPTITGDWSKPATPEIAALQAKLKNMAEEDQAVRFARPFSGPKMEAVDRKHLPEIVRIHQQYGWPRLSLVGREAANQFWLLVQHQGPDLQRMLLPEMEALVREGEASRQDFALLYDRVQKGQGKPQRWGTQTSCVGGKAVMDPVEDPDGLAERRRELYMQPIEGYVRSLDEWCRASAPQ